MIRLNEPFHECHLVDRNSEKEPREFGQSFFAEISAPVEVVASGLVAVGKKLFVFLFMTRQPARDRPHRTGIERVKQHGMGHESRDAAIAVKE